MSDKRYEANIIRATAVEPANNLESTSAPGVWSIDEVVELQKKSKWPTVGNVVINVDSLFSTFVYEGTNTARNIENGIALGNSFSSGSGSFSGTSANTGTRVNIPTSANFNFGTGDFTIEAFIYLKTSKNYHNVYDQRTPTQDATTNSPIIYIDSNNYINYYVGGAGRAFSSALSLGVWYHVAVTRASGSTKLFLDGTQQGSAYSDSLTYVQPASDFSFGGSLEQNNYNLDGYISNLRVVKGTAIYTSNFTAPTAALTAVSGTSLLAAQGSTPFVDNSGNNVTLTQQQGAVASDFGPFTGTGGEGGLVWFKSRESSGGHSLYDTARGVEKAIYSNNTNAEGSTGSGVGLTAFNSSGFNLGTSWVGENTNNDDVVSWTFRKQAKFFDVVTYTGNSTAGRTVSHNLGSVPGMILVKGTSNSGDWAVYHRGLSDPTGNMLQLNSTTAEISGRWNNTAPTSTQFTLNDSLGVNGTGRTFVAYIFAHNNNDGGFGPDQDGDIIKCGSYIGNENADGPVVDLGFEPQWLMIKSASSGYNWIIVDVMRGFSAQPSANTLFANTTAAEDPAGTRVKPTSTGFQIITSSNDYNKSGNRFVYMAIRRSQAIPTAASQVFAVGTRSGSGSIANTNSNVLTDASIILRRNSSSEYNLAATRLTGTNHLQTNASDAEGSGAIVANSGWDTMNGLLVTASNGAVNTGNLVDYSWKRARGYFDVTTYVGTNNVRTVNHNLGVVPEMIWLKCREGPGGTGASYWVVYHKDLDASAPEDKAIYLDTTTALFDFAAYWNDTAPTSTVFTTGASNGNDNNASGQNYVAYLFATLAGVSKLGSYTGSSSGVVTVDCGFTSGARFVLIKRTDASGGWYVYDSARGINSGADDPYLLLNATDAETTNSNNIEPHSSGFQLTQQGANPISTNGASYIFYAIA